MTTAMKGGVAVEVAALQEAGRSPRRLDLVLEFFIWEAPERMISKGGPVPGDTQLISLPRCFQFSFFLRVFPIFCHVNTVYFFKVSR